MMLHREAEEGPRNPPLVAVCLVAVCWVAVSLVAVLGGEQRAQARSCSSSKQKQVYYDTTTLTHCIINIFNNKS